MRQLINSELLKISPEQAKQLIFAIAFHNNGDISDDPTIGVCWDADRLDLPRVNILPDAKYLSTQAAKDLMWKMS